MAPFFFADLPNELVAEILQYLDYHHITRCRQICRYLKDLIRTDSALQLSLELAISGLADGSMMVTCAEKVERLRELRRRWRVLQWRDKYQWSIEGACHAYELVDGLFVKTDAEGNLFVLQLPSVSNPVPQVLCHSNLGIRPGDFALDPVQDLIVFLNVEDRTGATEIRRVSIRVCSLSTQEPHPDASKPVFYFDINREVIWGNSIHRAITQIAGDAVATFISSSNLAARLIIWNWRTGKLIVDSEGDPLPTRSYSFSFINERSFYITSLSESGLISVYTFDPSSSAAGRVHVAILELPEIREVSIVHTFQSHCEPFRNRSSPHSFASSPDKQIHVFNLTYITVTDFGRSSYSLYVPSAVFLDYIAAYESQPRKSPAIFAQWDSWGCRRTRFIVSSLSYRWLRYVHGQRVVSPVVDKTIQVLDFNVHDSLPHGFSCDPLLEQVLYMSPTVLPCGDIFVEEVVSRLPYLVTTVTIEEQYDSYMIDQERIVALSVEGGHGERISKLSTLTF